VQPKLGDTVRAVVRGTVIGRKRSVFKDRRYLIIAIDRPGQKRQTVTVPEKCIQTIIGADGTMSESVNL
jgi:hypothetical protein